MNRTLIAVATFLAMFTTVAAADDKDALIALDKQWGESNVKGDTTVAAKLLADKVVSVSEKGVRGKQAELADNEPDTAIMTHGTKGADAHYSLHVWSRKGGTWQVIATSTTPAASGT